MNFPVIHQFAYRDVPHSPIDPKLLYARDRSYCSEYTNNAAKSIVTGWRCSENKTRIKCCSGPDLQTVTVPRYRADWLSLRDQSILSQFIEHLRASIIYFDITGIPHHIWMPLVKVSIGAGIKTNCIYVEPQSYTYNPTPKPGEFFDLSERIRGFSPIPTFAHLVAKKAEETTLIPLLGFEGIRFRHLIEKTRT